MHGTLTVGKNRGPKLTDFWFRHKGISKDFSRINLLAELPPAQRLLAALLRGDGKAAKELLDDQNLAPDLIAQLIELSQFEAFGSLVFERIFALDLAASFATCGKDSSMTNLAKVKDLARSGAANHFRLDEKFAKVLALTKAHRGHVLWVKGAHLSRTIYQPPYFRHFGDLDVIVHPSSFAAFVDTLKQAGFVSLDLPAHCNQIGVGPVQLPVDIITAPSPGWIPFGAITMSKEDEGLFVDIKIGPFERGIQAVELERLFSEAEEGGCLGHTYLAPNASDHLMIMLCNFANNKFDAWRTLFDIHLLCGTLNKSPELWTSFVKKCKIEAIATTVWVGLSISVDRLSTSIPDIVLRDLAPEENFVSHCLTFSVAPAFVWNSTSLPMKILNVLASTDWQRKASLLIRSFFPSTRFLCDYYGNRGSRASIFHLFYLPMHWFVLLMPGGFTRRTLGKLWWSSKPQF